MRSSIFHIGPQLSLHAVIIILTSWMTTGVAAQTYRLNSDKGLQPHNVTVDQVTYQGRHAVRVRTLVGEDAAYDAQKSVIGGGIVLIEGSSFHHGTIEVDVAGKPQANAPALARGFVGIAFRVPADASRYDYERARR